MEIGTKVEMNINSNIIQGVICKDDIIAWDSIDGEREELGDMFEHCGIRCLPHNWRFKYIKDDGSLR